MADPSLLILLMSLIPVVMHSGSFSDSTIFLSQSTQPLSWFCLQEPCACLAFLIVLSHLFPQRNELWTKPIRPFLSFFLLVLFVVLFLGGMSLATLPMIVILFGLLRWVNASLVPLKQDQWLRKGWGLLVPLTFFNILLTSVRIALS